MPLCCCQTCDRFDDKPWSRRDETHHVCGALEVRLLCRGRCSHRVRRLERAITLCCAPAARPDEVSARIKLAALNHVLACVQSIREPPRPARRTRRAGLAMMRSKRSPTAQPNRLLTHGLCTPAVAQIAERATRLHGASRSAGCCACAQPTRGWLACVHAARSTGLERPRIIVGG